MIYKNIKINVKENIIVIKNPNSFVPSHIFENGQCFRWNKVSNEHYIGVAMNRVIEVKKKGKDIEIYNTNINEFKDIWYEYFDFGTNYNQIKKDISVDSFSKNATEFASGLRVLKQDYFEVLLSFIISQNNNIPRIKKIIEKLCKRFGNKIEYKGNVYYSFVERENFEKIDDDTISFCRAGYRCKYISKLSMHNYPQKEVLSKLDLNGARKELLNVKGVGPKVADCVLLFSGINRKAFPIDVWIKKVLKNEYSLSSKSNKESYNYLYKLFGDNIGIAQQYIFYYAREVNEFN